MKFSKANSKIEALADVPELMPYLENKRKIFSFDLLSGWSCPFAVDCLSKVVQISEKKRKIKDGKNCQFRCFSASQEISFPNVYNSRKNNYDSLRGLDCDAMVQAIESTMPKNLGICRIHVAGDFFNATYFRAWLEIAKRNPDRLFYAYTKSLPYWVDNIESIPYNMVMTASYGGRRDDLIDSHGLRSVKVVFSEQEAADLNLAIDHDDSHAAIPSIREYDFALLIHGIQPKGSEAAQAIKNLKAKGTKFSYAKKKSATTIGG